MILTAKEIAGMIDLSCVRTTSNKKDIDEMVAAAFEYGFGQVTSLQSFLPYIKKLLDSSSDIHLIGNVGFPSGSESTSIKVAQAKEMITAECDEIDMVMNVGKLKSGLLDDVEDDIKAVLEVVHPKTSKIIIEISVLTPQEVEQACEICVRCGAIFIKTGTGWVGNGTTVEDVRLIKSIVGDRAKIKAAGGIRELDLLSSMYKAGARRFGVGVKSGISIVKECLKREGKIEV